MTQTSEPVHTPMALEAFLQKRTESAVSVVASSCTPLTGGYSRVMTRFEASIDGQPHHLVARGDPPPDRMYIDTDRAIEHEVLEALQSKAPGISPRVWGFDADGSELGTKTIVMDLVGEGASFLTHIREDAGGPQSQHLDAYCDLASRLHAVPVDALPARLPQPVDWDTYIDSLIADWREVEAEHNESDPFFRYLATWLDTHRPPPAPLTLVHGELQPSNIVVEKDGHLVAVDWELAHVGDPREDFGWCKFVGSVQPPDLLGLDDAGFCESYCERTGLGPDVVNPLTIGYFSIMSSIRMFRSVLQAQRALVDGINLSLRPAYTTLALITAHEQWYQATKGIEAAMGSLV